MNPSRAVLDWPTSRNFPAVTSNFDTQNLYTPAFANLQCFVAAESTSFFNQLILHLYIGDLYLTDCSKSELWQTSIKAFSNVPITFTALAFTGTYLIAVLG